MRRSPAGTLVAEEGATEERLGELRERLIECGQVIDGRPLCPVLRPHLVSEEMLARQGGVAALIRSGAEKVRDALLADERLADDHLGIEPLRPSPDVCG